MTNARANKQSTLILIATGFLGILLTGTLQALYGPSLPFFKERFELTGASLGLAQSANFLGSVLGVFGMGFLGRWPINWRAGSMLAAISIGAFCVANSPAWGFSVFGALLAGIGFGGTGALFNALFATSFPGRSVAMLNWLSAAFGVGSALGPWLVGTFGGQYYWPFTILGIATLATLPIAIGIKNQTLESTQPEAKSGGKLLIGFALGCFLYAGIEGGTSGWAASHLEGFGLEPRAAANILSLFWLMLTLGRVLAGFVTRISPAMISTLALVLAVFSYLLAHNAQAASSAYVLAGFGLAPIFPSLLAWASSRLGAHGTITTMMIAGNLGGIIFSPLIGLVRDRFGSNSTPSVLVLTSFACLLTTLWLIRQTRSKIHTKAHTNA